MIKFHKIRVKNFLSYGNSFTELDVTKTSTTLITATNGSGKSVWTDALTFGLFGKSFRKVNKGDLVNSINGKNCVVELEFSIGSDDYKISRGIKPNNLSISLNGMELDHLANVKDAQEFIEDNVLRMSFDAFTQIVILGSSSYTPFMSLPAKDRRNVIETIMDIAIFSDMNKLLKEDDKKIRTALEISQAKLDSLRSSLQSSKNHLQNLVDANKEFLADCSLHIQGVEETIDEYRKSIAQLEEELKSDKSSSAIQMLEDAISSEQKNIEVFTQRIKEIKEDSSMDSSKSGKITQMESDIESLQEEIKTLSSDNETIVKKRLSKEIDTDFYDKKFRGELAELNLEKRECTNKISEVKSIIRSHRTENEFLSNNDICPVCHQDIDDVFKEERLNNNGDCISIAENTIREQERLIAQLEDKEKELDVRRENLKLYVEDQNKARSEISKNDNRIKQCSSEIQRLQSAIQKLIQDKSDQQTLIMEEQDKITKASNTINSYQNKIQEDRNSKQVILNKISEIEKDITRSEKDIAATKEKIKSFKKSKSVENENNLQKEIDALVAQGKEERSLYDNLDHKKDVQEHAKLFLKDDGIKAFIIKKYIPVINHFVNKYLSEMGFFAQFSMDENFEEVIRNRFRDDFKYTSFSEGERKRIDLALLFTWRQIAKMKNSVDTNLLFLDEIFDSSLDSDGVDMFMGIVKCLEESNVFIISHKGEMLYDLFERVLSIEKIENFSVVEELEV